MPVINEPIETLNSRLIDHFGIDYISGQPIWRIVYSEDQYEKRLTKYTHEGLELLYPEVRELPKYKQWIHNKYILEQLVIIPETSVKELPANQTSYEPLYVFEDSEGNAQAPKWEAMKFIIDTVSAAKHGKRHSWANYMDSEIEPGAKEQRLMELEEELFGNESDVCDALSQDRAIVVPSNYKKVN